MATAATNETKPAETKPEDNKPVSTVGVDMGADRLFFAAHAESGLEASHIRAIAGQEHQKILADTGSPEKAVEALDKLKASGAISEGMAAIYRDALVHAGGDSNKFAERIVEKRQDIAAQITKDMESSPLAAISILDNMNRTMTDRQVDKRSQVAYESLLKVHNNDVTALKASIDRAAEAGQLSQANAVIVKNAVEQAGTDAARFGRMMSENKDGLSELALIQASTKPVGNSPQNSGAGDFSNMFGGLADSPIMNLINQIMMAVTGGKMDFTSMFANIQKKLGENGDKPEQTAAATNQPAQATSVTASGPQQEQPAATVTEPHKPAVEQAGSTAAIVAETAAPQSDAKSTAPIMTTTVTDSTGITEDTTPTVDLQTGSMTIGGLSMSNRFGGLANPAESQVTQLDPHVDPDLQTRPTLVSAAYDTTGMSSRFNLGLMA